MPSTGLSFASSDMVASSGQGSRFYAGLDVLRGTLASRSRQMFRMITIILIYTRRGASRSREGTRQAGKNIANGALDDDVDSQERGLAWQSAIGRCGRSAASIGVL